MSKNLIFSYLGNGCVTLIGVGLQSMNHNIPGIVFVMVGCFGLGCTIIYNLLTYKSKKKLGHKPIHSSVPISHKSIQHSLPHGYAQDERAGWLRNPITDEISCRECWYKNKTITPLIKDNKSGATWICPECKEIYISFSRAFNNFFIVRYFVVSAKAKSRQESKKKSFFNRK